ncbi:MAG: RES family NAD+ phosphorylase [Chthoniobacteraceae bacterium]|jgi:RES domain-containing protein
MIEAWRIVKERRAATAFSGDGAWEFGGRWNLPGTRMVYASQSKALAALELLVHLIPPVTFKFKSIRIEFDESLVSNLDTTDLPDAWTASPPSLLTQRLGSRWAQEMRSAILAVPSAIIPEETNYLINPLHTDFSRIKLDPANDFAIDPRLLQVRKHL